MTCDQVFQIVAAAMKSKPEDWSTAAHVQKFCKKLADANLLTSIGGSPAKSLGLQMGGCCLDGISICQPPAVVAPPKVKPYVKPAGPPPPPSKIEQEITYKHLKLDDYKDKTKEVYEFAYAAGLGIYDIKAKKFTPSGAAVDSTASAARRADGIKVKFSATVPDEVKAQAVANAEHLEKNPGNMVKLVQDVATAQGATAVPIPSASDIQVAAPKVTAPTAATGSSVTPTNAPTSSPANSAASSGLEESVIIAISVAASILFLVIIGFIVSQFYFSKTPEEPEVKMEDESKDGPICFSPGFTLDRSCC
jgi:hypothetical protein